MNDCLFCKIAAGEIPAQKVYEDTHVIAFLDIKPVHLGHTLVVPKEHAEDVFSVSPESWGYVQETVRMLSSHVLDASGADGINLIMNNRRSAGQLVDHVHIHIIPRFTDDGMKGLPQHEETPEVLAEMAEKIRNEIA